MEKWKVKIKPEYCNSPEEARIVYNVLEDNFDKCLIEPVDCNMMIKPTEMVAKEMLEVIK